MSRYGWLHPLLGVRPHPRLGRGVFAGGDIAANALLAVLGGQVIRAADETGDFAVQVSEELVISPPGGGGGD